MARKPSAPSRSPRPGETPADSPELGETEEQRSRHQRFAHEQYSGSEQGKHGAPAGRNLPLDTPKRGKDDYPDGTRMPWPKDAALEDEQKRAEQRPQGRPNPAHLGTRRRR